MYITCVPKSASQILTRALPNKTLQDLLDPLEKMMSLSERLSRALSWSGLFIVRLLELLKCREVRVTKKEGAIY